MDTNTLIAVVGVSFTALGLFLPGIVSNASSRKKEYRKVAAPILTRLLVEIETISNGSYPFRTINESDLYTLLPFTPPQWKAELMAGFYTYLDAHSIAETRHWHDDHPADLVFFPTAFIVSNPDEVLKRMEPLKKILSK